MITNLTLADVFGVNATQDSTIITIQKIDLSVDSVNPESLLVALLLKVQAVFEGTITDDSGIVIASESGQAITYDNQNRFLKLNCFLWRVQLLRLRDASQVRHTLVFEVYTPDVNEY